MERDNRDGKAQIASAVLAATRVLERQYPDCLVAFLAGSVVHGNATATSDLDVVVIVPGNEPPFKEVFEEAGWPVEIFGTAYEIYRDLFARHTQIRSASLPVMCFEGVVLKDTNNMAQQIKDEAKNLLDQGPAPLTKQDTDAWRYAITSCLDDIEGARNLDEYLFVAPTLAEKTIDVFLAYNGQWGGTLKERLRALQRFDAELATRITAALRDLYAFGNKEEIVAISMEALNLISGRFHQGYSTRTRD